MAALFNGEGVYVAMLPAAKGGITADALYKTDRISGPAAGQAYPRCMSLALLTKRLPVNLPPSASGPPPLGVLLRKDLLSPYVQCLAVSLNPPVTQRTCPYFSAAKHKCQCQGGSDLDCARQSPAQQEQIAHVGIGSVPKQMPEYGVNFPVKPLAPKCCGINREPGQQYKHRPLSPPHRQHALWLG